MYGKWSAAESSGAAAGLITQLGGLGGPAPFTALMLESWSLLAQLIAELEGLSHSKKQNSGL
jgi:hypothetical protein